MRPRSSIYPRESNAAEGGQGEMDDKGNGW